MCAALGQAEVVLGQEWKPQQLGPAKFKVHVRDPPKLCSPEPLTLQKEIEDPKGLLSLQSLPTDICQLENKTENLKMFHVF